MTEKEFKDRFMVTYLATRAVAEPRDNHTPRSLRVEVLGARQQAEIWWAALGPEVFPVSDLIGDRGRPATL
jgi:hypothetical protein